MLPPAMRKDWFLSKKEDMASPSCPTIGHLGEPLHPYCEWTESCTTVKHGKPFVCLQGNHQKLGFLRWCKISSIHSMTIIGNQGRLRLSKCRSLEMPRQILDAPKFAAAFAQGARTSCQNQGPPLASEAKQCEPVEGGPGFNQDTRRNSIQVM